MDEEDFASGFIEESNENGYSDEQVNEIIENMIMERLEAEEIAAKKEDSEDVTLQVMVSNGIE